MSEQSHKNKIQNEKETEFYTLPSQWGSGLVHFLHMPKGYTANIHTQTTSEGPFF